MTKAEQTHKTQTKRANKLSMYEYNEFRIFVATMHPECQVCGKQAHDLHHLRYGRYGADKDDRSLLSVCRDCHLWCHKNKKESQEKYMSVVDKNWEDFK